MSRVAIAALPRNQRTFGNSLREFVQLLLAPLNTGFNLDRYDRELRSPLSSVPRFATDSMVWHVRGKAPVAAASRGQSLGF